ncbi:cell division protein ZapA [Jeotgalibaca sp. A127]|uniref:cell division protein ZapA n=1 Tax=Jeotgalibaca sp. A127 TaxID=3457324 RepID=UPI003FD03CA2
MSEEKRRFKTIIAGRPYTILANKPEEHLKTVSEIANDKITQIKAAMPELDIEQRSVLVAVNAISDAISKQVEINELKQRISELEKGKTTPNKSSVSKVTTQASKVLQSQQKPVRAENRLITKKRTATKRTNTPGMPSASKEKLLNRPGETEKR